MRRKVNMGKVKGTVMNKNKERERKCDKRKNKAGRKE